MPFHVDDDGVDVMRCLRAGEEGGEDDGYNDGATNIMDKSSAPCVTCGRERASMCQYTPHNQAKIAGSFCLLCKGLWWMLRYVLTQSRSSCGG